MKSYQIWMEGFRATGEGGPATFLGEFEGEDFVDACRNWAKQASDPSLFRVTDGVPIYWGCRLFDNEKDARELFG